MRGPRPGGGGMLNVGKLAPGGEDYYLNTIAAGVEDYYLGLGEAPGGWIGTAAAGLGLEGSVSADGLRSVLGGIDPTSGQPLTSRPNRRIPGFDLCFRAPKSVSLLWGLADRKTSTAVRDAHDRAVATAIGFLEDEVIRSRRGRNGVEQVEVTGVVGAAFRHRTSRAQDPLLHTHVLVANCVQAVDDDTWRTLDSRRLYRWARTAGFVYQAQLRRELTQALGVEWEEVTNGYADIAGIPRELIEKFSTRRAQILARLEEVGEDSARAAQVAALDTRTAKHHHTDIISLADTWRQQAAENGFGLADLNDVLSRKAAPEQIDLIAALEKMLSADGLTEHASTFDRRDVIRAWAAAHPDGADVEFLQQLANATLDPETGAVIDLDDSQGVIRRLAPSCSQGDGHRYSTPELLALEQRLLEDAADRVDEPVGVASPRAALQALRAAGHLSDEQRTMMTELISSGRGVEVVVGKAGSGKTTALAVARAAWEDSGLQVAGCALAARAACELERGSGIRSTTIHRLLADLDRYGQQAALPQGSVLVVDEAGMVGTRMLARLLDHAQQQDVKLVLVGDHHQLPEIDAGGAFAALVRRLPSIELTDNRRQEHPWERDALDHLRHGDPAEAVTAYYDHHRISAPDEDADPEAVREQLVGDWHSAAIEHGLDAVMIAARRTDVADLNVRARQRLDADGTLTGPVYVTPDGTTFQQGDTIVCLRNDHDRGVVNGLRATVEAINPDNGRMLIRTCDDARPVVLYPDYLDAGHVDHGYAITAHKAQGMTCDATFVLADETITREWGYVALSRGRTSNRLYLSDGNHLDVEAQDTIHPGTIQPEPSLADTLIDKLRRSGKQELADELLAHPDAGERVARRLHDLELHRQQQERELGHDLGHGLSL